MSDRRPSPLHSLPSEFAAVRPALVSYARRAVRDPSLAEDLVQDTFVAASGAHDRFEGRARPRTWLIGILCHKIADHFRAKGRAAAVIDPDASIDMSVAANYRTPESHAARKQALSAMESALGTLAPLERLAVLSVDVEGVPHDEASHSLGVTATHLRVLLHRARHKLRKAIEHALL